ncbi:tyrosine-type recombinase/integrase [Methylorubrum extorquens]|uniref:tyrosine-type recombinase/integrase n=1 Tax=Methylorubrum extorquens TaxID=408 RepID=UPI001FF044A9|nr:tyrosine-type recombinase/integrase [Methylorubrum extorquens]
MRGWYDLAGLDGGSSHSGRRWFITRLTHAGISPKAITMLAGHRHLSTTRLYIDVNDEMMFAAGEVLYPSRQRLPPSSCVTFRQPQLLGLSPEHPWRACRRREVSRARPARPDPA